MNAGRRFDTIGARAGAALLLGAGLVAVSAPAASAAAPSNDLFSGARVIAGVGGVAAGTNVDATKEAGEPDHAGVLGNKSVWFRWTAPQTGRVEFDTLVPRTNYDTILAVYTGTSVDALTRIAANDDAFGPTSPSRLFFRAQQGTTYRIAIDGVAGKSGLHGLHWAMRPGNDDFAAAETIVGPRGTRSVDTSVATRQVGEPRGLARSVWYRWTAPATRRMVFNTKGSRFDTLLSVYRGGSLTTLRRVAFNDDTFGLASRVAFDARRGVTYRVVVSGFAGESGPAVLNWRTP